MIADVTECGPPLEDADLQLLESNIGFSLPERYRRFVLKYNGGRPAPRAFPIEGLPNNPFGVVHFFFGINDPVESCNLEWNFEAFDGRIPSNLLAIGRDDGGDLICLSIFGDDAGAVVFWDRHTEPSEPSYQNVYHIADSFEEFLDSIQELPN